MGRVMVPLRAITPFALAAKKIKESSLPRRTRPTAVYPIARREFEVLPVVNDGDVSFPKERKALANVCTVRAHDPATHEPNVNFVRHGTALENRCLLVCPACRPAFQWRRSRSSSDRDAAPGTVSNDTGASHHSSPAEERSTEDPTSTKLRPTFSPVYSKGPVNATQTNSTY